MALIHLWGDSFFRGFGTAQLAGGGFADLVDPALWHYPLRSVASTINLLFSTNGAPYSAYYAGPPMAEDALDLLDEQATAGLIGAGDIICVEDAGTVPQNPDEYLATLDTFLSAAVATGARVIIQTTPDTSQAAWQALGGYGSPPVGSRFDVAAVGSPSGISRSPNDCIRDAAAATGAEVYDFGAAMLTYATYVKNNFGLLVMHSSDWTHTNLWGQMLNSYGLPKAAGLVKYMPPGAPGYAPWPARRIALDNLASLRYTVPVENWDSAVVDDIVGHAMY